VVKCRKISAEYGVGVIFS